MASEFLLPKDLREDPAMRELFLSTPSDSMLPVPTMEPEQPRETEIPPEAAQVLLDERLGINTDFVRSLLEEAQLAADSFQLPRSVDLGEVDPLGILEIKDRHEVMLGYVFDHATDLAEQLQPELDTDVQEAWQRHDRIELPEQWMDGVYGFRMSIQHNPKAKEGSVSMYRIDPNTLHPEDEGLLFTITRAPVGYSLSREIRRDETELPAESRDEVMINVASALIARYSDELTKPPEPDGHSAQTQIHRQVASITGEIAAAFMGGKHPSPRAQQKAARETAIDWGQAFSTEDTRLDRKRFRWMHSKIAKVVVAASFLLMWEKSTDHVVDSLCQDRVEAVAQGGGVVRRDIAIREVIKPAATKLLEDFVCIPGDPFYDD